MSPITQTPVPLSDEWATPVEVFAPLHAEFGFTMDAAAKPWNAKVPLFLDRCGLTRSWHGEVVWLNPPYSNIAAWLEKAYHEGRNGATVVCLVPASPDRHWWSDWVEGKAVVRLLTRATLPSGRVHFVKQDGSSGRAPFASAILIYGSSLLLSEEPITTTEGFPRKGIV